MSRITKLVAAAALLAVPLIQACGEDPIPPPATGTITGKVMVEGDGFDGVTVTLSSGVTATTANGGGFSFADVEEGTYTVTISNYADASFPQTSAPATIANDGETVTVNFTGAWIRTAAIMGTVMVEDEGLSNVTVKITGMSESETLTGATGQYAFTGLRAGNYTIEISGFDSDDIAFGATSSTATLTVGESKVVSFDGTYLRASGVSGQVSVEGVGLAGVTVSLQGRGEDFTERTNAAGQFMFDKLRKGEYAVAISGYDDDEYGFETTSKTVTVARGETGSVPFEGIALRTAGIKGTVSVAGHGPLDGVTVSLSGKGEDMAVVTNAAGQWSFDRLHAGDYSVAITGYDRDEFGFDVTSENVTVALKETATVEFEGILLRTAAIEGEVTVKGDALPGVTVTVSGGPKDEEFEETTNGAGMYEVGDLHAGDYSVTISGYDTDEYGFEVTTKSVSVGLRETAEVAFDGILLRTAGVSGRVTIDDEPMSGLTVTLAGEEDRSGMTDGDGQYAFSGLAAGDYTLTLSGYDTDEYEFDPSMMSIELELDEAAIHNFMGRSLRTVVIMGTVSAEGDALMNVGVTLIKVLGATTGEVLGAMMTDEDGGYMFDELLAGVYRIELGETDDEYDFATKSRMGAVATDETAMWSFDADIVRTASVGGEVTLDGDPMGDVMVMLTGDHDTDMEMETDSDGEYMFDGLRKGSYTVSIENPDEDTYDFPTTSRSVSLSVGQEQDDVSFAGSMLRRASISGQVFVTDPDMSLEGVMVTLDGDMEDEVMTDANGEYNFPGLAGGDYEVEIENPDEDAYIFEVMEIEVEELGDEEARIVDFEGEHTTTASVSGMLFADEVKVDSMHTEGEPVLAFGEFPLLLQGPGVNDSRIGATDSAGMYSFDGLKAGTYNVVINMTTKLRAALAHEGYAFSGNELNIGINVPAATDVDLNLPFRIVTQTINVGAAMGTRTRATETMVPGVTMKMYPTAEDADDGTNILGTRTTGADGMASFSFPRSKNTGPGGEGHDNLVFVKVTSQPTDLVVSDNDHIEIEYESVDRESDAPTGARLLNTRANFQWWVKSNEDAKDGNEFLPGWKANVKRGAATVGSSTTGSDGKATFTTTLTTAQIPASFTIELADDQADSVDMREKWGDSPGRLTFSFDGLKLPKDSKSDSPGHDRGAIYVTWTTQTLVLGLYRETDDVEGFTNYQSKVPEGDQRPASSVAREMEFTLLTRDDRNRLVPYKYNHDFCSNPFGHARTDDREARFLTRNRVTGLFEATCLPADAEFTIRLDLGDDRVEVGAAADAGLRGDIEAFNEDDLSVGGTVLGTFGDGNGGVPEVKICLSSDEQDPEEATSDENCATWGYQWMTGSIVGNVGDQRGHKVHLEPTTDNHGAEVDSARSGTNGAYKIDGVQDGVYDITAYSTSRYKVTDDPPTKSVYVYHDEDTDDKDTLTKYVGTADQDTARWSTRRLGLKIMGYIGNDVNRDQKFRGDEAVAGITVRLTRSGFPTMTDTTDERGFYEFTGVEGGSGYTIRPSTNSYLVVRGYETNFFTGSKSPQSTWSASAQEYPSSSYLEEGDFRLPYVSSYTSRSVSNTSVRVCDDNDPPNQKCGTLYNFGLFYKDGEVEGEVNNLSGSANSVDLIFTDLFLNSYTNGEQEVEANFSGQYGREDLTEGDYTARIADAGWAVPCMTTSSASSAKPDDDGPRNSDGTCRYPAPETVRASIRGKDDFENMPMLHVYNERASSGDFVSTSLKVRGRTQGDTPQSFDTAVSWPTGWERDTGTEETDGGNRGTISWKSASVSFNFGFRNSLLSADASVEVKKGTTVCRLHRCTLDYNRTNSTRGEGEDKENTITVTVTAENGYDDHEYSLMVSRAAPIDDELTREEFLRVDLVDGEEEETPAVGTGDGKTVARAFTMETKNPTGFSMNMRIALMELGDVEEGNEYCAQRVMMVKEYNDDDEDALDALNPSDDEDRYEDDVCRDTRYRLSVNKLYEIEIESEDSVSETYYLNTRNRDKSRDAELESLEIDGDAINLVSGDTTYSAVEAAEQVTVEWETADENARVRATPRDADSQTDGHQFDLGEPNEVDTLTIRVISEEGEDTLHYVLDIQRANNVATLATLSADVDLNEEFDSETTSYTADAAHDDEEVVLTFTLTDTDASTDSASGSTYALGAAGTDTDVSVTVTAEDGSTNKTYTVTVSRASPPADPTAGVTLMEVDSVTPFSEEMTEGATDTIQVTLATEPTADSTVTVTVTVTTGLTIVSGGTLSFPAADWENEQELVLTAADDDDAEPNDADLEFTFAGDTLTGYHGGLGDTINVAFTETDTKGVNLTATGMQVNEAVAGTYTIVLNSQPVGGNVNIEISGAPSDVTLSATQLEFTSTDWSTAQTVTITPTNDTDTASHSAFTLSHGVLGGGYTGMNVDDVTVQVLDDEAPQVVITTTALTVSEGTQFTYNIALTQEPSTGETVTVDLSYSTGDFSGTTTVALTSSNFSAGETVTLTARNVTDDAERTISYTVTVADTDTSEGSETVYPDSTTATSTTVTVKNVPE